MRPGTEFLGAKEVYEETISRLQKAEPTPNNLADHFLNEKSLNIKALSKKKAGAGIADKLIEQSEGEAAVAGDEDDHEIRKRIQNIMVEYTQGNATEGRGIADHEIEMDPKYWRTQQQVV